MSVHTTAQPAVFHPYPSGRYGIYNRYLCGVTNKPIDPADCYMLVAKNNGPYSPCAPNQLVGLDGLQIITQNKEVMNAMDAIYKIAQDGTIESRLWPQPSMSDSSGDSMRECRGGQCSRIMPPRQSRSMIEEHPQIRSMQMQRRIGAPPSHHNSQHMYPTQMLRIGAPPPMLMIEAPPMPITEQSPPTRRRWPTVNAPGPGDYRR